MFSSLVEVLWTARYDYQPDWRLARHKHEYFQMIYFISGAGRISLGDRNYDISPGQLLLVKPNCLHSLIPFSLLKTLDIKFLVPGRDLRRLLMAADALHDQSEPMIADLFERIRREGEGRRHLYRELCNIFLSELLVLYLRTGKAREEIEQAHPLERKLSGDWIVQQTAQFIQEHLAEDCSLTQIARIIGRSDRHVRQHFKEAMGVSPRRYLMQCRIQKAQELIEYSNYSFKEIADKVGFKTVHHFTRAFHEICNETPGAWRRKFQSGICKDVNINLQFVNTNWTVHSNSLQ